MIAVVGMGVIMNSARFIIKKMSRNNEHDGEGQQVILDMMEKLFSYQESNAKGKYQDRCNVMMMLPVAVP